MPEASVLLVLHAHLPFVKHVERLDPPEEDWLHECILDCYLPLLGTLQRCDAEGIDFGLAISFSPTLVAMLDDPALRLRTERYLKRRLSLIEDAVTSAPRASRRLLESERARTEALRARYVSEMSHDLLGGFAALASRGCIELLTTCATHAFLPAHATTKAVAAEQIGLGLRSHARRFGHAPAGFWLPECGYHEGLDRILAAEGVRYTFVDTHSLTAAHPRPADGVYAPIASPAGMVFFGRDPEVSTQVWSREVGYPAHPDYRELYRDLGEEIPPGRWRQLFGDSAQRRMGIKLHRITGAPLKEPYRPRAAAALARRHAADFLERRREQAARLSDATRVPAAIVAPFDAELFGHWWYEGPAFLEAAIRRARRHRGALRVTTPSRYLRSVPALQIAEPAAGSWGEGGQAQVWIDESNAWLYPHLHRAARELRRLVSQESPPRAFAQARRELLLAQSSDWPFLMRARTSALYAESRARTHLERFREIGRQIRSGRIDDAWLSAVESVDSLFPDLAADVNRAAEPRRSSARSVRTGAPRARSGRRRASRRARGPG
ncbi:MAG: 1,4-alpha-glucan branching protein domain-containing protein [Acidobacteriota bacterium]